ncbi:MAG: hypothetical protein QM722_00900 [Piscinibacter sp.]
MMTVSPGETSSALTRSMPCSEPDVIRISSARAGDGSVALQLADEEIAQGAIAERAAFEAVGGKRAALAADDGVDRLQSGRRPASNPGRCGRRRS